MYYNYCSRTNYCHQNKSFGQLLVLPSQTPTTTLRFQFPQYQITLPILVEPIA